MDGPHDHQNRIKKFKISLRKSFRYVWRRKNWIFVSQELEKSRSRSRINHRWEGNPRNDWQSRFGSRWISLGRRILQHHDQKTQHQLKTSLIIHKIYLTYLILFQLFFLIFVFTPVLVTSLIPLMKIDDRLIERNIYKKLKTCLMRLKRDLMFQEAH